ncbi:hypothetical protein [Luteolibacter sp. AS25]|uniref:hypothetical protein n=1 Tax=Luteolibacter sp. AS25 TaxID=3135776 RepID=UPI00398A5468
MKIYSRFLIPVLLLLTQVQWAGAETRQWTSDTGQVINAELKSHDGESVTLFMNGKDYVLPLDKLSQEDRDWLEKREVQMEKRLAGLLGMRKNAAISHRYGETTEEYFQGPFGKKMREFYDTERSICDVPASGLFMKCDEAVAWKDATMLVYCPTTYKGESTPMGVYISIAPGPASLKMKAGYEEVLGNLNMIYASPSGASNKNADVRRMALALDTLATIRKEYVIDEDRIFVGGSSGGGAMSSWMAVYFPEFRGAINQVRNAYIPSDSCFPTIDEGDIRPLTRRKQAYAFVTGPKDSNYKAIVDCIPSWEEKNFIVKLFDIPGMGHSQASADSLEKALRWAEESSDPPKRD